MADCLFCKLVSGEYPSTVVYQDDKVFAIEDVQPEAPVHVLIVPRDHYENMNAEVPDDVVLAMHKAAREVAKIKGIDESGYRVLCNNGQDADQTIYHMHYHLLGGATLSSHTH